MKVFTLVRVTECADGTFGMLIDEEKKPVCLILERPWLNNQNNVSCIPKGEYICKRENHHKFLDTFLVQNVPGRDGIYFHKGNLFMESKGCPLFGQGIGEVNGMTAVISSGLGRDRFFQKIGTDQEFKLVIV